MLLGDSIMKYRSCSDNALEPELRRSASQRHNSRHAYRSESLPCLWETCELGSMKFLNVIELCVDELSM